MLINRNDLEASVCRDSFSDFVKRFWAEIIAEKLVWNWHMQVLCDYMQASAERVFLGLPKKHDLLFNIPPGTTKSTICSIMFPAWVWTRMPSAKVICSSYAHDLAMDLSRKSRDVVLSEKYARLFPDIELREDQNTKSYYANTDGGFRIAVGTGGNIIGFHGHFIIVDDPINPKAADSEAERKAANNYVGQTLSTRKVDKAVAVMILIMQRLHQNDPSAMLLEKAEQDGGTPIKHICLPGAIEGVENAREVVRPRRLAKYYNGGLLDPVRMSRNVLRMLKSELGEQGYAGQILQRPAPPGGAMFKVDRIEIDEPPALRHFKSLCRYWDKAGTKDGGAFTAGVLLGIDAKGRYCVYDVVKGQWDSGKREAIIKQTASLDAIEVGSPTAVEIGVEQEPGSGGKESAENTARNLQGYLVTTDRPTGSKETRADVFSVQVNAYNVYMKAGPWNKRFLEELEYFPRSTYKDQVDAVSGAFKILSAPRMKAGAVNLQD